MTFNGRALFSLIVLVVVGSMVITGFDYSKRAAMFPVAVGAVVFVMALLQFIGEVVPATTRYLPFLKQKGVSLQDTASPSVDAIRTEAQHPSGTPLKETPAAGGERRVWLKVYGIIACLSAFTLLMYHTQFLLAVPVFLVLFIWLAGGEKLLPAVWVSAGTLLFLYLLFKVILRVTF
jgi:hypothetical protein